MSYYNAVFLCALVSFVVAGVRVLGVTHATYQAAAHVWVGLLLGLYLGSGERPYLWLFAILCVVEIAMATITRI